MSGRRAVLRAAWPAMALAAAVLLPFLGNAFTVDDTMFLFQAQHVLTDPLHPTSFEFVGALRAERMSHASASGPGMAYLLVPCVTLGGGEWVAHLTQLALFMLALLATASLARHRGAAVEDAQAACLLLAATPAALGMAGTAMPDVPAMAFGVVGVERAVAWARDRRWHQGVAACAALTLAVLFRSHLALLLGVAALAMAGDFLRKESWIRLQKTSWLPLILCPFAIVTILIVTRDPGSNALPIVEATSRFVHGESIVNNLVAYGTHWVVALPFAVPWLLLRWRSIVKQPVIYVALPAAWLGSRGLEGPSRWVGITAAVGAAALGDLLLDGWKRRDAVDLGLAAWLALPLAVVPYLQLPSKFLVAAAPAAALAVARALSRAPAVRARAVLAGTVLAGAVLGILILRADAVFAGLGRRAAAELIPSTGAIARTIWFDGHWGFQWYAEKAGARPLSLEPPSPEARDLIVSSDLTGLGFLDHFPTRRLLATVTETRPGGRVMSRAAGAGFFTNDFGLLPWAWGNDTLDRYDLWVLDPVSTP